MKDLFTKIFIFTVVLSSTVSFGWFLIYEIVVRG
jgi:hypothetical protein